MAKTFISVRWLLVGVLGLGLWLTPGATYGQSRELLEAFDQSVTLYGQGWRGCSSPGNGGSSTPRSAPLRGGGVPRRPAGRGGAR